VIRHFHRDDDDVDVGAAHEVVVVVERERDAEALAGGRSGFAPAGDSAVIAKSIRERPQGGDVRLRRPAAIRIGADDADANFSRS